MMRTFLKENVSIGTMKYMSPYKSYFWVLNPKIMRIICVFKDIPLTYILANLSKLV